MNDRVFGLIAILALMVVAVTSVYGTLYAMVHTEMYAPAVLVFFFVGMTSTIGMIVVAFKILGVKLGDEESSAAVPVRVPVSK